LPRLFTRHIAQRALNTATALQIVGRGEETGMAADQYSVGDWGGNEQLAADNVNRIYAAILESVGDDCDRDMMEQIIHSVWDRWGSAGALLTITDDEIADYVKTVMVLTV
jgi:hypothetical protein